MRYDTDIAFITYENTYDPESSTNTQILKSLINYRANVYDLGTDEEFKLFGVITNTHKSIIILGEYTDSFTYVLIENSYYKLNHSVKFRNKQYFTVEYVKDVDVNG